MTAELPKAQCRKRRTVIHQATTVKEQTSQSETSKVSVTQKTKKIVDRLALYKLLPLSEAPEYLKGFSLPSTYLDIYTFSLIEKFIYTGYRVNFTAKLCFHSLFRWHNETCNIWTHVIGTLLFCYLIFHTIQIHTDSVSPYQEV